MIRNISILFMQIFSTFSTIEFQLVFYILFGFYYFYYLILLILYLFLLLYLYIYMILYMIERIDFFDS